MSILFKNADILIRKENGYDTIHNGFLGVDGKYIDYIGKELPSNKYDVEKDYHDRLLMPGLVNGHTHLPMVFLRGLGMGNNLHDWLFNVIFPAEDKLNYDLVKIGSFYGILELLKSGVTSFSDMYYYTDAIVEAVIESGIKANISRSIQNNGDESFEENYRVKESLELFDKYNNTCDGRIKMELSVHAEYTNKEDVVRKYSEECKRRNAGMHIHLSETESEVNECMNKYGVSPVKWFEELGTLDNRVVAAHCVAVDDEDIAILKKHNVNVVHNPTSNMLLGSGFMPLRKLLDNGINVGLGTDGCSSNNNMNMFEEMHLASIIHNGFNKDASCIKPNEVIDMATINGAKLQGRNDTGVLEVGKCADIIAIDLDAIHNEPDLNTPVILTLSTQASDVVMTMVDGKVLYEDGNFLTLDENKIRSEFKEAIKRFY